MKTGSEVRAAATGRARASPRGVVREWGAPVVAVGLVGLAIMAFFVSIYQANHLNVPLGFDTSKYLWRTRVIASSGFEGLAREIPAATRSDPGRPAFPTLALTLSASEHATIYQLAAVLPAVAAAAIGLSAGAFVSTALRRPPWELVVVALGVGTSAFVVRLAGPETYQDNLFAAAAFMAAAIPVVVSVRDRGAIVPAIVLFGAAGVIHWAFFVFMLGALGLAAVLHLPASYSRWRSGETPLLDTPAARLAMVGGGGTVLAGGFIFGVIGTIPRTPRLSRADFARKLRADIPKYKFGMTLPLAAFGVGWLAQMSWRKDPDAARSRTVLAILLSWCAVALAGYVALTYLHLRVPAHRFLAFALAVPLLATIGVLWVARGLGRWSRVLAGAFVGVALAAAAFQSHVVLFKYQTWMDPEKVRDAATAGRYLDASGVAAHRPIILVAERRDASYTALMAHMARVGLPPERAGDVYLYVGTPENYLAHRPTPEATGRISSLSQRYFDRVATLYDSNPVAFVTRAFNQPSFDSWLRGHPEALVAPGVALIGGTTLPRPHLGRAPLPVGSMHPALLGVLAAASLALLAAIGLGWALALLGPWLRPIEMLGVAPAVGIGAVVLGGILLDRLGIRLQGGGGVASALAMAGAGWALFAFRRAPRSGGTAGEADG